MKNRKKKGSKNQLTRLLEEYNQKETTGNINNTLLKSVVDITGVTAGTGLGALSGDKAKFIGPLFIAIGHYIGDKSGLLRMLGASTLSYGIAKSKEFKENPALHTVKGRMKNLKGNWLSAMYLDMKREKETGTEVKEKPLPKPSRTEETPKILEPRLNESLESDLDFLGGQPDFINF